MTPNEETSRKYYPLMPYDPIEAEDVFRLPSGEFIKASPRWFGKKASDIYWSIYRACKTFESFQSLTPPKQEAGRVGCGYPGCVLGYIELGTPDKDGYTDKMCPQCKGKGFLDDKKDVPVHPAFPFKEHGEGIIGETSWESVYDPEGLINQYMPPTHRERLDKVAQTASRRAEDKAEYLLKKAIEETTKQFLIISDLREEISILRGELEREKEVKLNLMAQLSSIVEKTHAK